MALFSKKAFLFDQYTVSIPDITPDIIADIFFIIPDNIPDIFHFSVLDFAYYMYFTVGCLNNDRSVMSKSYAWRPLAILPILQGSACTVTDEDWLRHRRLELYHRSMDHIISDINKLCSSDIYLRFADDQVRCCRTFYHLLVMDGTEVAAALLCDVNQCPVCTCPHSELDRTDFSFPYRDTESVKDAVNSAREEHLNEAGEVRPRHKDEVFNI